MTSETKIDNSFSNIQFHIERYCVYRLDQNEYGSGAFRHIRSSYMCGKIFYLN